MTSEGIFFAPRDDPGIIAFVLEIGLIISCNLGAMLINKSCLSYLVFQN
jgi:hypothetical protein